MYSWKLPVFSKAIANGKAETSPLSPRMRPGNPPQALIVSNPCAVMLYTNVPSIHLNDTHLYR